MKSILKLGTQELGKNEQKSLNRGNAPAGDCDPGTYGSLVGRCCFSDSHGHCY